MDAFSASDPLPPGPLPYADITNPQSLNKYTYTYNNPLNYVDPDGHDVPTPDDLDLEVSVGVAKGIGNFVSNTAKGLFALVTSPVQTVKGIGESIANAAEDYGTLGVSGVADRLIGQGKQEAVAIVTEAVLTGGATVAPTAKGGPKPTPPGENAAAAAGRTAHAEFAAKVKAKPSWQSQPRLKDPLTGKTVKPDALTKSGRPLELKPRTPSGKAAGKSQLRKQERAAGKKGRVVHYD